jgi:hypothetical protein
MDAIILAAGRNARLTNYVPAYHKPLIPLPSGQSSLLRNAVELAMLQNVERPVVVASPRNAFEVDRDLAGLPVDMVIQRVPTGPGDALRLGLALKVVRPSERVLVLLSDNTLNNEDISHVCRVGGIGVHAMHHDDAEHFTWYDPDERRWREKESIPDRLPQVACWVGPFVGYRTEMEDVLNTVEPINGEYLIGPHLTRMTHGAPHIRVSSMDVGTEESYLDYMKGRQHY